MEVAESFELIARAIATGRVPSGYLLSGEIESNCAELTALILDRLFPGRTEQLAARIHPDVYYLEPEGASQTIHAESMRERLLEPMTITAYSGGWKAGVIVGADRMEPAAANAFLKMLEEPPPKTLFLLLTDAPEAMLPTIVSRTARIQLPQEAGMLPSAAATAVRQAFESRNIAQLAALAKEYKASRKQFFRTLLSTVREYMVEDRLPRHQAFRNVDAVEDAYRQCTRFIDEEAALSFMMDRVTLPPRN